MLLRVFEVIELLYNNRNRNKGAIRRTVDRTNKKTIHIKKKLHCMYCIGIVSKVQVLAVCDILCILHEVFESIFDVRSCHNRIQVPRCSRTRNIRKNTWSTRFSRRRELSPRRYKLFHLLYFGTTLTSTLYLSANC